MPDFFTPDRYRPAMEHLAALTDAEFDELRQALTSASPTLQPEHLIAHVKSELKKDEKALDDIIKTLVSVSNGRELTDVSVDESVRDLLGDFSRNEKINKEVLEPRLKTLLDLEVFRLSARAFDVQHQYEKLFVSARIMSDVRAVFDPAGTASVGAMIVHNLIIQYSETEDFKEVFIALDDADLVKLRRVLDRAEAKSGLLVKLIAKTGLRYFTSK